MSEDRTAPIYEVLTAGQYYADFAGIKDITTDLGPSVRFMFHVYQEDGTIVTIDDLTSSNFGPKAKQRLWAEALLGRKIEPGEVVSFDDMLDTRVLLLVSVNDRGYNKIDTIELVTPPPATGVVPAPAAAPAAPVAQAAAPAPAAPAAAAPPPVPPQAPPAAAPPPMAPDDALF